jgi:hypothetical protein
LNGYDRLTVANSMGEHWTIPLSHFYDPERVRSAFRNGIPISLATILNTVELRSLFGEHQKEELFHFTTWYHEVKARSTCPKCICRQASPFQGRKVYDFGHVYVQGISFGRVVTTFPFPCGIKTNCVNIRIPKDDGELFYYNFLIMRQPKDNWIPKENKDQAVDEKKIKLEPTTDSVMVEPSVKIDEGSSQQPKMTQMQTDPTDNSADVCKFSGPYHSYYWASTFGGLNLASEIPGAPHAGIPLLKGLILLPPNMICKSADDDKKWFFKEERRFVFIPRDHHLFHFFTNLYEVKTSKDLNPFVKKSALFGKNLKNLFYQFIKLPVLSPLGKVIEREATKPTPMMDIDDNSDSQSAENDDLNNLSQIVAEITSNEGERLSMGHGIVMDDESLKHLIEWFMGEYTSRGCWLKEPIGLENINFLLFRANTKDFQWLVESDQKKMTLDQMNEIYSFSMDVSLTFSVFPMFLSCSTTHVATGSGSGLNY